MTAKLTRSLVIALTGYAFFSLPLATGVWAQQAMTDAQAAMAAVDYSCARPDAGSTTKISVAALPIVSNAAMFAAADLGIFAKHGLSVEFTMLGSLPPTISAVQGGAVDFAFTGTFNVFQAAERGIDLVFVAPFAGMAPGYWDKMQAGEAGYTREITAILVAEGSGIDNPGDLEGKVLALPDRKGQFDLTARAVIRKHGGDPEKVKYVVMNYTDSINALMAGQVDAALSIDPQIRTAEAAGYKIISWPGVEALKEGPTSAIVSTGAFIANNPETVARMNCVIREAAALALSDPDLLRKTTAERQKVDPSTLANSVVPYFYSSIDIAGLQRFYEIQTEEGFVTGSLAINKLVIPQALSRDE
ncbi:MAG TPA: ABC transporter substrate-binding protein [Shinella sp.]|jgi:NitT/TauT family transport system substrate-binding protein|uniref:ABC transporter substrate-binding protein n=1 Tax=Shinella sp. TaxID=1870904 RepID=UPI002E13AC2E|nr:ABC transporter substrate-binding protein [Shinella sp.]